MNGPRLEDFAMTTKQIKKGLLVLSSLFLLAGCDEIEAKPNNYEENIVVNTDAADPDIYKNSMGEIWDSISSNKADKVLEEFLKIIYTDKFGGYDAIKDAVTSEAKAKEFIAAHKIFQRDGDADLAAKFTGITVDKIQKDRLDAFEKDITKRVNEAFYNEIKSGTYSKDNMFYEERLAWAHYSELYDVKGLDDSSTVWNKSYITPEFTKEDVSSMIHLDRFVDYINRKLLPEIFKEKLVEEYIYRENYSTLGQAYGRKVNIIKLSREEKYESVPGDMMKKYVETRVAYDTDAKVNLDFEELANAWRGFSGLTADGLIADPANPAQAATSSATECKILSAEEEVIAKAGGAETGTAIIVSANDSTKTQNIVYYKNTKLGILLEKYNKITAEAESNRWVDDETKEAINTFTNNNSYPKEVGLRIKLAELAVTDYTTDGWYVKNGGLTDLPDAIRNRLFNINVAQGVDSIEKEDDAHPYNKKNYVRNINGNYFLTPASADVESAYNYVIYDSGNYYLINVVEAVSSSKIKSGDNGYVNTRKGEGALFTESVAMELAKVLGTKDSYTNDAYGYYIEDYALQYHDQKIYDYFKDKFPELFEED